MINLKKLLKQLYNGEDDKLKILLHLKNIANVIYGFHARSLGIYETKLHFHYCR